MMSAASPAVASMGSVIAGTLMTSPIGAVSGRCGSTMRPITSCRVKMPSGLACASTTGMEPIRWSSIVFSAAPSGVPMKHVTGACRSKAPSDVASPRCSVSVAA